MKASADRTHPAYHPLANRCRVFLDGAERSNVITADEEGRCAVMQRLDERGRPVVKAGVLQTEVFYGHVRIECPEPFPPAFASGGFHSGGLRLVGEAGPELEVTGLSWWEAEADADIDAGRVLTFDTAAAAIAHLRRVSREP